MSKGFKIFILVLVSVLILSICGLVLNYKLNIFNTEYSIEEYTVKSGDCLWKHIRPGDDIREYVNKIYQLNEMTSSVIHSGDIIKIYVPK